VSRIHLLALLGTIALPACTTLEAAADHARGFAIDHPAATAVAVGVVAGGIAIAVHHHHDRDQLPTRSDAGSCVVIEQTLQGPIPVPCH
jgi:hypothetical protein